MKGVRKTRARVEDLVPAPKKGADSSEDGNSRYVKLEGATNRRGLSLEIHPYAARLESCMTVQRLRSHGDQSLAVLPGILAPWGSSIIRPEASVPKFRPGRVQSLSIPSLDSLLPSHPRSVSFNPVLARKPKVFFVSLLITTVIETGPHLTQILESVARTFVSTSAGLQLPACNT